MQLKKMSVIVTITLIITIAAALSGCTNNTASPTAAPSGTPTGSASDLAAGLPATMDYSVKVTGGSTPVTLTYADLRAMQLKEMKDVSVVNSVGTVTSGTYVGVPLIDIVNKAGLPAGDVSFTAVASDGYKIDYTKDLFDAGILALKTDGTPNTAGINDKYPISFVFSGGEKNMWIKTPVEIKIIGGAAEPVALYISGANVTSKPTFTLSALRNLTAQTKTITTTDSKNNTVTATGILLNYLLDQAGPKSDMVQFISGDASGFSKNVSLTAIHNSPDAIVAIDENGMLRDIIPGQPSNTWVSNLTKIRID
jgi:DMSO/TMAO reductase YedYZ molybdopterin-dependent catalytic subunit